MGARSVDSLIEGGNEAAERGDHLAALKLFDSALEAGGESWIHHNRGNSLREMGLHELAVDAFRIAWMTGEPDSGFNLALELDRAGRLTESRDVLRTLIDEGHAAAMIEEGFHLRHEGELSRAESLLQSAALQAGDDGDFAAGCLGMWWWSERADPGAEEMLRRGEGQSPEVRATLADLMSEQGRSAEAVETWERGVAEEQVESMIPYSNYLRNAGDLARAEALLRASVEAGDVGSRFNLYELLTMTGQVKEAEGFLRWAYDGGDELAERELRSRVTGSRD